MPPITSAMTRGWRNFCRGKCRIRQKMIMIPAFVAGQRCNPETAEANWAAYLDDEDDNGVLGVVVGGIVALEDTSLLRSPVGARGRGRGGAAGDRRHGVVSGGYQAPGKKERVPPGSGSSFSGMGRTGRGAR